MRNTKHSDMSRLEHVSTKAMSEHLIAEGWDQLSSKTTFTKLTFKDTCYMTKFEYISLSQSYAYGAAQHTQMFRLVDTSKIRMIWNPSFNILCKDKVLVDFDLRDAFKLEDMMRHKEEKIISIRADVNASQKEVLVQVGRHWTELWIEGVKHPVINNLYFKEAMSWLMKSDKEIQEQLEFEDAMSEDDD